MDNKIINFDFLLSQSSHLSPFLQVVIKNLLGFDSIREVVVVPAGKSNDYGDFKRLIILAIDFIFLNSSPS
ncbi:MAG: hypothetical protein IJT97_07180 [Bacteroidaceae bacterium]|nr:hypothetical protein [Bacteroidaceae bacterium]